ncbi:MAG: hypothetical protein HY026_03725 [Deltaproteobacteria bacterium]|nr:hypothetical protein [Deltaproteobacteria bacterium]
MQNLLLAALFIFVTLFTAFHEGYVPLISIPFYLSIIAGFSITIWLARNISTPRLLSLILSIFIIEYIKETIGIRSGMWVYHGINGFYNFGVWAWVLGGLIVYTLSIKVVIRQIRRLKLSLPGWLNPVILLLASFLIPLTMGDYWRGAGVLFWSFYVLLLIAGIYTSIRMDFPVFAGIVITAWIVGNPSEYLGSAASGVWTFTYNPLYPPFFLLFGCWPLEILAQYSLSAFLANEPMDKDTF